MNPEHAQVRALLDIPDYPNAEVSARAAATLLLLRDHPHNGTEVFMIHRHRQTAFGGAWAFPGGAIDLADIPTHTAPDPLPAARNCAVRETAEEVGFVVDPAQLTFWSHWLPPADGSAPKRFSTWFFVTVIDTNQAEIDRSLATDEVWNTAWVSPTDALNNHRQGRVHLVTPTFATLHQLASYPDIATALREPIGRHFRTRSGYIDGVRHTMWAGDAGYATADPTVAGARYRVVQDPNHGWEFQSTTGGW